MTETQPVSQPLPPLTVRVDRERVIAARRREKRIAIIGGFVELATAVAVGYLVYWIFLNSTVPGWLSLVFLGVLVVALAAFGILILATMSKKGRAYWSAENLPDVAFVVHADGVSIHNPETSQIIEVPWGSVRRVDAKRLFLRFQLAPGILEPKYRNQFLFGNATLDQSTDTIRRAMTALSGRDL